MAEQSQLTGAGGGILSGAATGSAFGAPGAIVGGVVGGVLGFLGGGGEKEAKKLAKRQANAMRKVASENKRRAQNAADYQVSSSKVATYASNIMDDGSSKAYRNAQEGEYRKQIMFDYSSALDSANTVREGGTAAAQAIKNQGKSQLIGGVTSAATTAAASGWNPFEKKGAPISTATPAYVA
jgi:hypothetical protein